MKILFTTDFSTHASTALSYAVEITNELNAELHILHVSPYLVQADAELQLEKEAKQEVLKQLNKLLSGVSPLLKSSMVPIASVINGDIVECIEDYASENNIDLIVIGTQGKNSLANRLIGSTAHFLIHESKVPVLSVPANEVSSLKKKKVLLALDNKEITDGEGFKVPVALAKSLDMMIDIVHIKTEREKDFPFDPFALSFIGKRLGEIEIVEYDDVTDGLNEYINSRDDIGMLLMLKREKGFFQKIFRIGNTSEEIMKCPIPMLTIHE